MASRTHSAFLAEFLGTAGLLCAVVGSGVMAVRTTQDSALALLANTLATTSTLFALILAFASCSGAHFNPAVTASELLGRRIKPRAAIGYVAAQLLGGLAGVCLAHALFDLNLFQLSVHARGSGAERLAEVVATAGLLTVIAGARQYGTLAVALSVSAFIAGGYWFTSSTCFANPAVTLARAFTDTFAGIRPGDVPGFVVAQAIGVVVAVLLERVLFTSDAPETRA